MINTSFLEEAVARATDIRQKLHRHPELPWQERATTELIADELTSLGISIVTRGVGGTDSGIIARIDGERPGPCTALRADIDALPVDESPDMPHSSQHRGVIHACGHDAHTAGLLGAARVLQHHRSELTGSVKLLFQPAEEAGYSSGAPAMIAAGALDGVDAIFGLHVWSQMPLGTIGWRKGALLASADLWNLTVGGRGGHGSEPQRAVDPTIAAASMISSLQTIVSREVDPRESVVVSIGSLKAGVAPNVIPDSCFMNGSVRTTDAEVRASMEGRFQRILEGIASAHRCTVDLKYTHIYPVTVNNEALGDFFLQHMEAMGLTSQLCQVPMVMGSEDFSFYGEKVPAFFYLLGMGTDEPHHSPRFCVDDAVLPLAINTLASLAMSHNARS